MRVIAGTARGCKLEAPEGLNTRPTADRIKEDIFNILSADMPGSTFLDIFSGTGGIAIEALSRGAAEAVLVEQNAECAAVIRHNLARCKFESARLMVKDCTEALKNLASEQKKFDFIFMDPPYYKDIVPRTINLCLPLLAQDGIVVVEQGTKDPAPLAEGLELYKEKKYAAAKVLFFRQGSEGLV